MKTMSIMKTLLVTAVIMISNVTISARTAESNLVYNAEEVNGVSFAVGITFKHVGNCVSGYRKGHHAFFVLQGRSKTIFAGHVAAMRYVQCQHILFLLFVAGGRYCT